MLVTVFADFLASIQGASGGAYHLYMVLPADRTHSPARPALCTAWRSRRSTGIRSRSGQPGIRGRQAAART